MKTLYLPLKKEWYDLIECGRKLEEYREVKPYWISRLCTFKSGRKIKRLTSRYYADNIEILKYLLWTGEIIFIPYGSVQFSYGYTRRIMVFSIKRIEIGQGSLDFGAPENKETFIIGLGERRA